MAQSLSEEEDDDLGEIQNEAGRGRGVIRLRQLRVDAQIQAADAQKTAARAAVRSARYMLWAVILSAISTAITAGTAIYILFNFSRATH